MARGGARNRSGPQKDPRSATSDALGVRFGKLPRAGYQGAIPSWPLTKQTTREGVVWKQAWRTPQAAAWATEPWRHRVVALWVRYSVRMEEPDASASLANVVIRLADQIGMTPAGLRENQWEIEEAPGSRVAEQPPPDEPKGAPQPRPAGVSPRDRMRVVRDGTEG